jgi:D-glycero-alpha-D-manno-heptose 1-phosphate guanylyltransferase
MSTLIHKEAIILAGGFGTRLRTVLPDLPKCMAPIHGKPFLEAMLTYLWAEGVEHIVLSLGYRHQVIEDYVRTHHAERSIRWVVEEEPLGTGGAIALALEEISGPAVFVLNGDTFFDARLQDLEQFHKDHQADLSIVVKHMDDASRYGTVDFAADGRISRFREKADGATGYINGGVYLLERNCFPIRSLPKKFSFEKDFLSVDPQAGRRFAQEQDAYFIDIGIPADFERAQREWTVFFPETQRGY